MSKIAPQCLIFMFSAFWGATRELHGMVATTCSHRKRSTNPYVNSKVELLNKEKKRVFISQICNVFSSSLFPCLETITQGHYFVCMTCKSQTTVVQSRSNVSCHEGIDRAKNLHFDHNNKYRNEEFYALPF